MKQKDLDKEGLTKEYLSTISVKKLGNPVQLLPNDEPVTLIKCSNGFWVSINSEIVKDAKNNYLVITDKEAIIGRGRYLLNFKEQIEQDELNIKIANEAVRLKQLTEKKVEDFLSTVKFNLQLSEKLESDISFVIKKRFFEEKGILQQKTDEAVNSSSKENYLETYLFVRDLSEKEDWDSLYIYFFQEGIPEIASFKMPDLLNNTDIDVLIKYFHRNTLQDTISEIQSKSHLENVAKFNIEKEIHKTNL